MSELPPNVRAALAGSRSPVVEDSLIEGYAGTGGPIRMPTAADPPRPSPAPPPRRAPPPARDPLDGSSSYAPTPPDRGHEYGVPASPSRPRPRRAAPDPAPSGWMPDWLHDGVSTIASFPLKAAATFDSWIDRMVDDAERLDPVRSMVVASCAAALLYTGTAVFWSVDAATQIKAYTTLGASAGAALTLVLFINAVETLGMTMARQNVGLILWGVTTAWNVWWNIQHLPETLSFAKSGGAWNLLLSIAVAAAPQFIMVVSVRVIGATWKRGMVALGKFVMILIKSPVYLLEGFKEGIQH